MPKASTFGLRTATQMIDSDTFPMLTNAGENVRLPVSEARSLVGPGWSDTINAYNEDEATDELKIQAAISRAVSTGADTVFIPTSMLPYDATLVTFNSAIQMVREGGTFDGHDLRAYGAVGTGVVNDRPSLLAADLGVVAKGGGFIVVPTGTFQIGSNITVSSSLEFATGGVIAPDTGVTVTINGSFNSAKEKKFGGLGSIVLGEGSMGEIYPTWWSSPSDTDDALTFQKAIDAIAATGGVVALPPKSGGYNWLTPINLTFTKTHQGIRIVGLGPVGIGGALVFITIKHTGHGFDCTGSSDLVFENISLVGDATTKPKTGWLLAREGPANGAGGRHRFYNCRTYGYFTAAPVWSYGSEENDYHGCFFINLELSCKVVVITGWNRTDNHPSGMSSSFVTISTGVQSNLISNFFGGSYWVWGGATSDVFYLESASSVNITGAWMWSGNTTPGRSLIYVDSTNAPSDFVHINGWHGESAGAGLQQKFGILFGNEAARTMVGWSLRDARITCGDPERTGVTIGTTSASAAITSAALFTSADQGAVVTATGVPYGARILSVTDASNATLTANATATASPSATFSYRMVFSSPNVILSGFHCEQSPEPDVRGFQFSGSPGLQSSYIKASNSAILSQTVDRCILIGNPANWVIPAKTATFTFDDLAGALSTVGKILGGVSINASQQLRATGWWQTGDSVGMGAELGVSGGTAFLFGYDRTGGGFGPLSLQGTTVNVVANAGGGTLTNDWSVTGPLSTVASATGTAGLKVPHGAAPTAPVNGDMWTTTAGLFVRINGATVGPLS